MSKQTSGTTPFPNVLLDELMPGLSDSAWKVLCVIVRSTAGWHHSPGRRKQRDWITHQQLKARTGKESAAISKAISHLVALEVIVVESFNGTHLASPGIRRTAGRLYYRLHSRFSQSEFRKAKTTKETDTKENLYKEGDSTNARVSGWYRASSVSRANR